MLFKVLRKLRQQKLASVRGGSMGNHGDSSSTSLSESASLQVKKIYDNNQSNSLSSKGLASRSFFYFPPFFFLLGVRSGSLRTCSSIQGTTPPLISVDHTLVMNELILNVTCFGGKYGIEEKKTTKNHNPEKSNLFWLTGPSWEASPSQIRSHAVNSLSPHSCNCTTSYRSGL